MFYNEGLPLAVSSFQVKHIIVKERHNELVEHKGVHKYMMVDRYYVDSILYYYGDSIHRLSRHSIKESDIDGFKETLKNQQMRQLLDTQVKPPIHECFAILALHKGKERLKRFLG